MVQVDLVHNSLLSSKYLHSLDTFVEETSVAEKKFLETNFLIGEEKDGSIFSFRKRMNNHGKEENENKPKYKKYPK